MPIKIPKTLPAYATLLNENVFVIDDERAQHQDIRTLRVAILNLMPTKIATETQLLRLLGNTPLQVEVVLLRTASYEAKNVAVEHLLNHYQTFDEVREQHFDGLIITGAPVELLDFEAVDYWPELKQILDWADSHVQSTLHLCWGAQAGLYHRHGIQKYTLPRKMFGIFEHSSLYPEQPLLHGFDETFFAPHSRHTEIRLDDLLKVDGLRVLANSAAAGVHIVCSKDNRHIYVTGHPEYDPLTLLGEYSRDRARGLKIHLPENYFYDNDPEQPVQVRWRSHANLLFANWLNYYVYQATSQP
ncbi:homoserine O-succinyltransferase [Ferriphaselus sp. R-1]|uniref:homoserine O-acetyltransferase MetA n=1 Tax=Ferriphaselus sp. R-1 TaxID=1485544 RepID=UPI00054E2B91|nr:homoserine O-succinyltransferase [Ferriphaselus sp. R-1]